VAGHDAEIDADNGRGFFSGWNLNTSPPKMIWVTYDVPPQPGSNVPLNPNFDAQLIANISQNAGTFYPGLNGSTNGYTTPTELAGGVLHNVNNNIVVDWKHMPQAQLNASLYNDWGQSFQTQQCLAIDGGGSTGSTGSGWGGAWLLGAGQSAGMVFVATNNKDPFAGPCNPGPDLWSASAIALNITTGAWIWAFQTTAHDIWDYDCSWYQGLANETIAGVNTEVVLKTCKDGYLFEINAVTGNLIWAWNPPSNTETSGPSHCPLCYNFDPRNASQMEADFPTAITNCAPSWTISCMRGPQPPMLQVPAVGFEDEQAFDPKTNMIYAAAMPFPIYEGYFGLNASTYFTSTGDGGVPCPNCGTLYDNATIYAINAATGASTWHYRIGNDQGYRGAIETSGNLVFAVMNSGDIMMVDATKGTLVRDYYIGAPMDAGLTIGASTSGTEYILTPVGTCSFVAAATCPGTTPGDIVALTLNPPTGGVTTVTSTTTSVSAASTVTSVSTTTVIQSGSSGVSATTLYGVAGVAVIFIIVSGYLAMTRNRKPAS